MGLGINNNGQYLMAPNGKYIWLETVVGPTYGPEMISNGDFADGSIGWDTNNWSFINYDNNRINITWGNNVAFYQLDASMITSIVANTDYRLSFDITAATNDGVVINFNSWGAQYNYIPNTLYPDGHYDLDFTTPANVGSAGLYMRQSNPAVGSPGNGIMDNISLKEIL